MRITLCAGAALVAALTPATVAYAGDHHHGSGEGTVRVTPSTVAPGGRVELRVDGCEGTTGEARSRVFDSDVPLSGKDGEGNPLYGEATVERSARPGRHTVTVTCDGYDDAARGRLWVEHGRGPTPTAPVHAGGGATARLAAGRPREEGPGLRQTVTGAVLAGAAVLAVTGRLVSRGRRRPE
ncbi:hypothetical protein [Streptomyces tsukubensis]|uniref:hypothetical protein n=1 Tax=Streptomyces tsukubensis TaxID=83656 RepID=UPI00117EEFB4|nr:hypothetical protein [Streptomyces tsukubensis]QFR93788.1 hypothetical protein GBW32_12825 [Streptomyces tsukubensis]